MKSPLTYSLLALLWSTTASASWPTYWGIGANAGIPIGSSRNEHYPFAIGNVMGYGMSLEFGQYFSPKIGYNIRVISEGFQNDKHRRFISLDILPYTNHPDHYYFSVGVNYKYPKYDVVLNANISIGIYDTLFTVWQPFIVDGLLDYWGQTYRFKDEGVFGFELGVTKKLKWGLHGNVFYHYSPLNKDEVGVGSIQFAGAGIKYLWGY
ncbi:MAG: hypothetical protein LBH03_07225 [Holophagales bacterium]|jgi:hypothetical protein|nr:hypothetical protein [Holophagales bacterium]